jgi:AGZA family xanthine/uracil permease-like MFS transporter
VGALFLLAMWFAPLASIVPPQATAPALIIVGFHMMAVAREIPWDDYEDAIPAFVTMLVMPFTWSITNGISAGFVTYGVIKVFNGKAGELPATLWLVWSAFVLYFALPLIERAVQ